MRLVRWSRWDQLSLEGLLWILPGLALLQLVVRLAEAARGDALTSTGHLPDQLVRTASPVAGPLTGGVVVQDPTVAHECPDHDLLHPSMMHERPTPTVTTALRGAGRSTGLPSPRRWARRRWSSPRSWRHEPARRTSGAMTTTAHNGLAGMGVEACSARSGTRRPRRTTT